MSLLQHVQSNGGRAVEEEEVNTQDIDEVIIEEAEEVSGVSMKEGATGAFGQ